MSADQNVKAKVEEADAAAALLIMVVQESAILARALAQLLEAQLGRRPPVFFVGGFLVDNTVGRSTIATSFRNLSLPPPLFLRHADFLGALGSLGAAIRQDSNSAVAHSSF